MASSDVLLLVVHMQLEANAVPGLVPRDGRPARGGVLLELRKMRLLDFQV